MGSRAETIGTASAIPILPNRCFRWDPRSSARLGSQSLGQRPKCLHPFGHAIFGGLVDEFADSILLGARPCGGNALQSSFAVSIHSRHLEIPNWGFPSPARNTRDARAGEYAVNRREDECRATQPPRTARAGE